MEKSTTIWKAGLAGLVALGSIGCQQNYSICDYVGRPPKIIVPVYEDSIAQRQLHPEIFDGKWKQEGDYWYRAETEFGGRKYYPKNLKEAEKLEKRFEKESQKNYERIFRKHGPMLIDKIN